MALLCRGFEADATGWKPNVQRGADIVMKDHRWPAWDAGTYYCFWYMSFVPGHRRLGSFYGGIAVGGPKKPPGMFMSYWGEVRNVHEGPLFYSHGYGAEGASGGAHGDALFLRPGAWYRFVMRIFPPATDDAEHAFVGWWAKDLEKNEWHTHSVVRLPAKATGFAGNSGFVEALGPPSVHRAFERRLGYCRLDGTWQKADKVGTGGAKFFKLIEEGTVLRYDRAEPDSPKHKGGEFVTRQPDAPQLDPPAIADASAVASGRQVAVKWSIPKGASPQLGYRLEVFDNPQADGEPMAVHQDNAPYILARRMDTPREAKSVRLTVTDIFDQRTSVTIPVGGTKLGHAAETAKVAAGLEYAYYEPPANTEWRALPDFAALAPVREGRVSGLDDTVRQDREKLYALRYTGYLRAPADGLYVFSYGTCDGSRMRLGGKVVADNDGLHSRSPRQYPVALKQGLHAFELLYFKGAGRRHHAGLPDRISIRWEGPGFGLRRLTEADFACADDGRRPSLALALESPVANGVAEDNWVKIRAVPAMRRRQLEKLQLYSGNMLLKTAGRADLRDDGSLLFEGLFPAEANRIWARLWYDGHHSVDAGNVLEFETRNYSDGPWEFVRLGHKFPLGARYKDGTVSFTGEGACVGYQKVKGDFTLTAHIADVALRTRENGVYDQNWVGLYTSNVRGKRPDQGLEATFSEYGFGIYLTAGRGMKGWPDHEDLGGSRMCIPSFPADHRWLRIVRRGKRYESFTSADGKTWQKAMELLSRHFTDAQYAGVWFRAVPGKGRGLFHGALDQITLEAGKVPEEVRPKVSAEDLPAPNRITALVQAAKDPAVLFARSPGSGLLKSTDRGETWKAVNRGLSGPDALSVRSVAVHPGNRSVVLRGGGCVVDGALKSGLWRSADGGERWTLVSREIDFDGRGPATLFGEVVAFCPQDPNLVAAAGETAGLFLSRDAGLTWQRAGLAGERVTCLAFNAVTVKDIPQLVVGTSADREFATLGLGKPATPAKAPGRLYWVYFRDGKPRFEKCFELDEIAVANISFGAYETFAVLATSRGLYYTWQRGNTFSQRLHAIPADRLFTALGYRQYPKQVGPGDIRTKSDSYAAPFSTADPNPVRWVPERTPEPWRPWAKKPRIEGAGKGIEMGAGVTCILPDREEPGTLYLCNRHGILKTTDRGKTYRLVCAGPPE